jgi:DNA-binding PadR family transcriptional regulator
MMGAIRMTQVTALVLRAVARGHCHGFDIMEACGLPSGTVYPALRRMDKAGLLHSGWEDADVAHAQGRPRRRTYSLAASGREALGDADVKLAEVRRLLTDLGPTVVEEA